MFNYFHKINHNHATFTSKAQSTKAFIILIQKSNLLRPINYLAFNFNFLLAHITSFITLMPGDIVTTGTPPGVGLGMIPPVFLKDGDKMELSVDNLGSQTIKVIAE